MSLHYLTWGNDENTISNKTVCMHVRHYVSNGGKWLHSNLLGHATIDAHFQYDVITLTSPDGKHQREVR
jgi:hypothetical protein